MDGSRTVGDSASLLILVDDINYIHAETMVYCESLAVRPNGDAVIVATRTLDVGDDKYAVPFVNGNIARDALRIVKD